MSLFQTLEEKYRNTQPRQNPITFRHNSNFKEGILGDKGKIYLKRGRMNASKYDYYTQEYGVPRVWQKPFGFKHNAGAWWITNSEIHAMNYYRESGLAQAKLKRKWNAKIEKQEQLLELSRATECDIILPNGIKEEWTPRPHQLVPILYNKIAGNDYILILDGMRSGKTSSALLLDTYYDFETTLIVCPAMLKQVWVKAINEMFDEPKINVLSSYDSIKKGYKNICSYDVIHTIDADVDHVILDEIHYILQKDARRSNGVMDIKALFKTGLSGTPILNKPSEILGILNWLDFDLHDKVKEYLKYVEGDEYEIGRELSKLLRSTCALQRSTDQLAKGGETFTSYIEVECNLPETASLIEIGKSKIPFAVEYANAYADEQMIMTVQHLEVARQLVASLGSQATVITGETPETIRKQIQQAFSDGKRILVGSMAIAEGLDFSFVNRILQVENVYTFRVEQLRRRCDRVGKKETVFVDILVAKHKKDRRIIEVSEEKYTLSYGFNV